MPIRRATPLTFTPGGLSDAVDGTVAPRGAMRLLPNLIPDPKSDHTFIARPAAEVVIDFTSFFANAGFESSRAVIGDKVYGTIATSRNAGKDEPYCYDMAASAFLTVGGVTNANTPTSPPSSGAWTPPIVAQVASRVIVTHPGFPGGAIKFGWWDVSGFTETTTGNTHSSITIDGNPAILGLQPGMAVSGSGIPANTAVAATSEFILATSAFLQGNMLTLLNDSAGVAVGQDVFALNLPAGTTVTAITPSVTTTTGNTHSNTILDGLDPFASIPAFGDPVSGAGIPAGTTVAAVNRQEFSTVGALNGTTTITTEINNGFVAGQFVSGPGIVAGTKVVSSVPFSLDTSGDIATTTFTITNLASTTGIVAGQAVSGFGLTNPVVVSVDSPTQVTISEPALQTVVGVQLNFSGASVLLDTAAAVTANFVLLSFATLVITMSKAATATASGVTISFTSIGVTLSDISTDPTGQRVDVTFSGATITLTHAATASADGVTLTIAGGTIAAPLWGAGDCDRNPLPSVPLGVAEFNGRAYFADGLDGIPFSDSGLPCRRSNQPFVQALTTNDGLPVTAVAPLMLTAPLTGGIVQALIAFQGSNRMRQITGDPTTSNLSMNLLPVATGSDAPLSIIPTDVGMMFVSPEGLRLVGFDGTVSPPIGDAGKGTAGPFINAVEPSRICAAANADVIRITTQNHDQSDAYQEYWFDLTRKIFTGPHTSTASLIQPWRNTFLISFVGVNAQVYRSDAEPGVNVTPSYVENGAQLFWVWETALLPDNQLIAMNAMIEGNLTCAAAPGDTIQVVAIDEQGSAIDATTLTPTVFNNNLRERPLFWNIPVVFKQMSIQVRGVSSSKVRVGNLYMRYQILGYNNDQDFALTSPAGTVLYLRVVPLTGDTLTAIAGLQAFRIDPLGELATLTVVMPPTPGDGDVFCISTTQTIDALTVTAPGGATMAGTSGGGTDYTLGANGVKCWQYDLALDQWLPA